LVVHIQGGTSLRVFVNRVLRRIFGPKRDDVTEKWGKLHNEGLNALYSKPNIIRVIIWRRMRLATHLASMGERRGAYRVLVGKPEEKRPLGTPWLSWEDNVKVGLQQIG